MASLVGVLASGVASAAGGNAEFYTHGTAVLSTQVYSDADGTAAETDHVLGTDGEIVRYVTEPVDIVVKDEDGAVKRQFTHIDDVRAIRVESLAFTGPNGSGQTVAGGRIVAQTVLTKLLESLGSTDGNVDVSGTATTLQAAIGTSGAVFYHVKTGYGAKGDGSTDDTSAVQAAINDAITAGGGIIYFPAGTYNLTSGLTVSGSASIMFLGAGADETILEMQTDAISPWLEVGIDGYQCIGVSFASSTATFTGTQVLVTGQGATFQSCKFGSFAGSILDFEPTSTVEGTLCGVFLGCRFAIAHADGRFIADSTAVLNLAGAMVSFSGCAFDLNAVPTSSAVGTGRFVFNGCSFAMRSATGGVLFFSSGSTSSVFIYGGSVTAKNTSGANTLSAGNLFIAGARLKATAGGTLELCDGGSLYDSGCHVDTSAGTITLTDSLRDVVDAGDYSLTRQFRRNSQTIAGTAATISTEYGFHFIQHDSGASMTFTWSGNTGNRDFTIVSYANDTGGPITPTLGLNIGTASSVPNGQRGIYLVGHGLFDTGISNVLLSETVG